MYICINKGPNHLLRWSPFKTRTEFFLLAFALIFILRMGTRIFKSFYSYLLKKKMYKVSSTTLKRCLWNASKLLRSELDIVPMGRIFVRSFPFWEPNLTEKWVEPSTLFYFEKKSLKKAHNWEKLRKSAKLIC